MRRSVFLHMAVVTICLLLVHGDPGLAQEPAGLTHIVVKFIEGLEIHLSDGRISGQPSSQPERAIELRRRGMNHEAVETAVASFNALLKEPGVQSIAPLFSNEARGLQPEGPGPGKPDLRLYFSIALKDLNQQEVERVITRLAELPIIETAYRAPIPENAGMELPTN